MRSMRFNMDQSQTLLQIYSTKQMKGKQNQTFFFGMRKVELPVTLFSGAGTVHLTLVRNQVVYGS